METRAELEPVLAEVQAHYPTISWSIQDDPATGKPRLLGKYENLEPNETLMITCCQPDAWKKWKIWVEILKEEKNTFLRMAHGQVHEIGRVVHLFIQQTVYSKLLAIPDRFILLKELEALYPAVRWQPDPHNPRSLLGRGSMLYLLYFWL
jgi:hypothetical protein